ncbi:MAG: protein kinase family protein [Micromonosporaceae bacterium]
MTQEGERRQGTPGATPTAPGLMTFGSPAAGDVFAERYGLEAHVDTDAAGRQIWRGIDVLLRRQVAVIVRQPGGAAAADMLTAAVAASRIVHPHLVSVYDAIDEGNRAYVVREWVPGTSLRDIISAGPLDAERSTLVTHAIAEAVAALHSADIVHGHVHPGTVLIADDGRVVLSDAFGDQPANPGQDVRAVGAVLYACLTGRWPQLEAGRSTLPDAVRDSTGRPASPRQVRGGIPRHLDAIAADLLDLRLEPPAASMLAGEMARLAAAGSDEYLDDVGPMGFEVATAEPRRRVGYKLALGIAGLATIAVLGAFLGVRALSSPVVPGPTPAASSGPTTGPTPGDRAIPVAADQVRVVDPPKGNRTEMVGVEKVVDGVETSGWRTDKYTRANFGGLKPGMGILIDLRTPQSVRAVRVVLSAAGASAELRSGSTDPGNTSEGDDQIVDTYQTVGQPLKGHAGTTMVFPVPQDAQPSRYLLLWITELPADDTGRFVIGVNEITVLGP